MTTESTATPAQQIAAGYAVEGQALELGTVVVDGSVDPTAQVRIPLAMLNRHGLVAGATGTGKTKTLQVIAEQLSAAGVPVLMADVKGDLSGLSRPGEANDKIAAARQGHRRRLDADGLPGRVPVAGHRGHRRAGARDHHQLRADPAVKGAGPQRHSGVDARADLPLGRPAGPAAARPQGSARGDPVPHQRRGQGRAEGASARVSSTTAGVILRALVNLEAEGGDTFFGEPEFEPDGPAASSTRRAAASSPCSSWATRRPGR